jgi:hypothetical protein
LGACCAFMLYARIDPRTLARRAFPDGLGRLSTSSDAWYELYHHALWEGLSLPSHWSASDLRALASSFAGLGLTPIAAVLEHWSAQASSRVSP